jgi:hypothetical protein
MGRKQGTFERASIRPTKLTDFAAFFVMLARPFYLDDTAAL